jgi:hypothetical protein
MGKVRDKHIIQIIKKIAKLNIGYCSTKFRIESKNIDYSTCKASSETSFARLQTSKTHAFDIIYRPT